MKSPQDRRYARRVVALILLFFGVIFAVDGTMISLAIQSRDGLVEQDYYLKGLRYNETLRAEKRFDQQAWRSKLDLTPVRFSWEVTDQRGQPVPVKDAHIHIQHPTRPGHDVDLTASGNGTLEAPIRLSPGIWNVEIRLQHDGQTLLHRERVQVTG